MANFTGNEKDAIYRLRKEYFPADVVFAFLDDRSVMVDVFAFGCKAGDIFYESTFTGSDNPFRDLVTAISTALPRLVKQALRDAINI